jgi:FtsH-binding integral membrane protein
MFTNKNFEIAQEEKVISLSKTFLSNVFTWMFLALSVTALISYWFGTNIKLISSLYNENGMTGLGWLVTLSPLAFVLLMSLGFKKLSSGVLMLLFVAFSVLMGMSLGFVFLIYTAGSIFKTFIVAAGMFGIMAFAGYTTKTDLSKFGSIMLMGLFGIIIASLVNMFMKSSSLDYIISFIGVLIFTGLTAYDVQKLKKIGSGIEYGTEATKKLSIMGALTLYLDFINLFLFLLRFLGNKR